MRFSSSFKVGILTLSAIVILVFGIMWIKGRALSSGERVSVEFKDINGMRAGSGVQMMGFRIGQVEEIIPIVKDENSRIIVKFVITEPDITIPSASEISIQQSGLIGEQFLEITPPKVRYIFLPIDKQSNILHVDDKVQMLLSKKQYDIGQIKSLEIVDKKILSLLQQENLNSDFVYKIGYIITLPGVNLPERLVGSIVSTPSGIKLNLKPFNDMEIPYPQTDSKYTIIEPMRLADFMDLQYRSAQALTDTNDKISAILSDDVISDLKSTAQNIKVLTENANTTLDKAQLLIDNSQAEIKDLMDTANKTADKIMAMVDNINKIIGQDDFTKTLYDTSKSINRLSNNISNVLEDASTKQIIDNLAQTSNNISQISASVNDMTKDEQFKKVVASTITKINCAIDKFAITLDTVNSLSASPEDRAKIKQAIKDAEQSSANLRKFSEKLNKRFLLFRLMF